MPSVSMPGTRGGAPFCTDTAVTATERNSAVTAIEDFIESR